MPPPGEADVESVLEADGRRRAAEYEVSVGSLNQAHREVATEVEEALLALRGRVDELLAFVQGGSTAEGQPAAAVAAELVSSLSMNTPHAPMWAVPSPHRPPR